MTPFRAHSRPILAIRVSQCNDLVLVVDTVMKINQRAEGRITLGACDDSMNDACQLLPRGVGYRSGRQLGRQSASVAQIFTPHIAIASFQFSMRAMRSIRGEIRGVPVPSRRSGAPAPRLFDLRTSGTIRRYIFPFSFGVTPHPTPYKRSLCGGSGV